MVKSVIRAHHYPPDIVDKLFLDDQDHHGIEWLYNDLKEEQKDLTKK